MAQYAKIAVPAARSSKATLAVRRRIVLGALLLASALGIFAACTVMNAEPPVVRADTAASPLVAFSTQVATDYLNAVPTTVPTAEEVDPTFGYLSSAQPFQWSDLNLASITTTASPDGISAFSQVRYFVKLTVPETNEDGETVNTQKYFLLTVPMVTSPDANPRLGTVPTLQPMNLADGAVVGSVNVDQYPGAIGADDVSPEVSKVVKDWATAYATGGVGSADLKRLTRDPSTTSVYTGLGGWTVEGITIDGVLGPPREGDPGYVVRTTLRLTPPGGVGPTAKSSYDVWVAQTAANEANPPILAWGPAGAYTSLRPYMNAVNPG